MTTEETENAGEMDKLAENVAKVEELSQQLMSALQRKKEIPPSLQGPDQELFASAATAYFTDVLANPSKLIEQQAGYWGQALQHYVDAQKLLAQGKLEAPEDKTPSDRRFQNELWQTHPFFNFVKQQYMMSAEAMRKSVSELQGLDPKDLQRVEFFSQQIMDMMSPTNFLATNPEALTRAVETEGESLVKGLENLVRDLDAGDGNLVVTLADKDAFKVGENLATTKGSVVFRNRMFELIQYAPQTEKVKKTPLIIFPPWINKFYVLDLKPKNSLINWIVEQGYTLFVVSWVNPDASYADVSLDTYIEEGYLTAVDEVKKITGEKQVNAVGYCIAGTTLALTLALMKKRGDKSIKSATLFTTLTDFSDQGEVGVFLNNDFVDGIEREVEQTGYLSSYFMNRTFSFLRSNDLIYGPAIRSYMMGEKPPAFDLLYWNGDSTNLPAKMAIKYLRNLCQDDMFAKGEIEVCGEVLGVADVGVPICAIACETDHIAAWKSSYDGVRQMGAKDRTFILSQSGHIAGIVNPPSKNKYGHYLNPEIADSPDAWLEGADFHAGSWWPHWEAWLKKRSGAQIKARIPGDSDHPILGPAPGTYVVSQPKH